MKGADVLPDFQNAQAVRVWLEHEGISTTETPKEILEFLPDLMWNVTADFGATTVTVMRRKSHPAIGVLVPFEFAPSVQANFEQIKSATTRAIVAMGIEAVGSRGAFQVRKTGTDVKPAFVVGRFLYPETLSRQLFVDTLQEARNIQFAMSWKAAEDIATALTKQVFKG